MTGNKSKYIDSVIPEVFIAPKGDYIERFEGSLETKDLKSDENRQDLENEPG